jgi:hypothetical protein
MELQQIMIKKFLLTVITLENYFITWALYSPSGANKVVVLQSSTVL